VIAIKKTVLNRVFKQMILSENPVQSEVPIPNVKGNTELAVYISIKDGNGILLDLSTENRLDLHMKNTSD
jgi:hypothetical protein